MGPRSVLEMVDKDSVPHGLCPRTHNVSGDHCESSGDLRDASRRSQFTINLGTTPNIHCLAAKVNCLTFNAYYGQRCDKVPSANEAQEHPFQNRRPIQLKHYTYIV